MIDTMPDVVPIVDHVPELDGLILATGMSAHGFGIGTRLWANPDENGDGAASRIRYGSIPL